MRAALVTAGVVLALLAGLLVALRGLEHLDEAYPPDLSRAGDLAYVLLDRDGEPLRYLLADDDRFRLGADPDAVDPKVLELLIAYEDRRFWSHAGVDPLAVVRALGQWVRHGRLVSGASTLTMQTARLLEPHQRNLRGKLFEMVRAIQLERRFSKREILALYLKLAPYGGNIEGIEAASRHYFGKAPGRLTLGEAALLVALPQSPSRRRPDRYPEAALDGRAQVLDRVWSSLDPEGELSEKDLDLARAEPLTLTGFGRPALAPHLADRLLRGASPSAVGPVDRVVRSCVDRDLQASIETVARRSANAIHPRASTAVLVVHNRTAEVRAYIGGADYLSDARAGQVDLVDAVRSPGSTLKPLIYGLAFEHSIAAPATTIADVPTRFGHYVPANFEGRHHGLVSVAEALASSLNVPAVALLERIGPARFVATLRRHDVALRLPGGTRPGLAVALGGVGSTLHDLTRLYRAMADDGRVRGLRLRCDRESPVAPAGPDAPFLGAAARWHLQRILRDVPRPGANPRPRVAFKTGTSYGYRDAWAVGFDRDWTVGVWVGRADGTPLPGVHGRAAAAPILLEVFDRLPAPSREWAEPPPGARLAWDPSALPPARRNLFATTNAGGPRVLFPLPDTRVLLRGGAIPLEASGGTRPYTWLIDGRPIGPGRGTHAQWQPDGPGFVLATVVDARGRSDRVRFRLAAALDPRVGRLREIR